MKVHEVIYDARLQIVLDPVDDDLMSDVDQLAVCEFRLIFVDGLIHLLVIANPVAEICCRDLWILALVIRRGELDLSYV